jgi:hypothetical protein
MALGTLADSVSVSLDPGMLPAQAGAAPANIAAAQAIMTTRDAREPLTKTA